MVSQTTVRQNIARAVRTADLTTVSAKQIRRNVESELGLERDELASLEWKAFVKTVIEETMATIERGEGDEESEEKARMRLYWGIG
jgi:DEK C terminal domain